MPLLSAFLVALLASAHADPLWVTLGPQNASHGLTILSQGDGQNAPDSVAGSACRSLAPKSCYLYVQADPAAIAPGNHEAFVTVEYFDRDAGLVNVEYDRAVDEPTLQTSYTLADDVIVLGGSGKWMRGILRLADARFGKGQNWQADFRLRSWSLTVRRVEVSLTRPPDYVPGGTAPEVLEAFRAHAGPGMEVVFGCVAASAGEAKAFRMLGATGVETYCTRQTVEDAAEGGWDWSRWDKQLAALQAADLKWVPAVIAGPGYATPQWYRESPLSFPYVCLEHHQPTKIQSLWNPAWRNWIERFWQAFADRYRDRDVLESALLCCSGTYGETLYPAGPETGWPFDIPGLFHNHLDWWAAHDYAVASFRRTLQPRYRTLDALNHAWEITHATWDEVQPFLPDTARSLRSRLDMVDWYVQSMIDWAGFWAVTARKALPDTELYLCVGGAGKPILGADFSAQAGHRALPRRSESDERGE